MNELLKILNEKFGLSEATAKSVVETVLGFVKGKLPEGLQGMVD